MALPISWTQVPITGQYVYLDGGVVQGRLSFDSPQTVEVEGVLVAPHTLSVDLDATGSIPAGFKLPSTNAPSLSVIGWAYKVTEQWKGARPPYQIFVPHDAVSVALPDATPVEEVIVVNVDR